MSVVFQSEPPTVPIRTLLGPALLFFGLIPVLIGFLLGATRAGVALHFPWSVGMAFWVVSSLGTWLCMYAGTALAGLLLRPWRPPLWLILVVGAVLGSLPGRHVVFATAHGLREHMLSGREPRAMPPLELSGEFVVYYLQGWAGVYAVWLVLGLLFDRFLGFPRYSRPGAELAVPTARGAEPAASSAEGASGPSGPEGARTAPAGSARTEPLRAECAAASPAPLLGRLPDKLGRHVVALEAEDHYVRVHTDLGSTLVLARLSDAITDLGPIDGIRVHRSWWVRRDAVRKVSPNGKGLLLRLSNGIDVPVSQAYKELARQAGLQPAD